MLISFKTKYRFQKKQRLKAVFLLIALLCLILIFSGNAFKLFEKYFVNDHREVLTYIKKTERYNTDSIEIVDSIRLNLYRTYQGEYSNEVKMAREDLQQVINHTVALTPPHSFEHHKNLLITVLQQRMLILTTYNQTKKTYVFDKLKMSVNELSQMQDKERKELLKALKKEGIHYKQLGDGSIRYWYKSHSAKTVNGGM
ncbi:hypothetical protein [Neobacillus sp. PS3-40]|uniref:hypothetical protein n=1 Tax=Neobacillus sp. PS3-40 TaxID=3070679 RepID=UPI0027E00BF8|nr:hypothetical protein [Neobacillus sp. PS3-40]WML46059.1 hypothetical protein RCG20_09305 [Neobacillus sp. PS3-40]